MVKIGSNDCFVCMGLCSSVVPFHLFLPLCPVILLHAIKTNQVENGLLGEGKGSIPYEVLYNKKETSAK